MKTLGLIGGTSWTSTIDYYRYLNEETARRLGGLHSARLVLTSLDFADVAAAMHSGRWDDAAAILRKETQRLDAAGVDGILLCSNLLHKFYDDVCASTDRPVLHIGDALAESIKARRYTCVALLGAQPTMEEPFYRRRIQEKSGASVLTPPRADREFIDTAIFDRMCKNIYTEADRTEIKRIVSGLKLVGAEAVILGCTELPVLLKEAALPLLDSTLLHSRKAAAWACGEGCPARPCRKPEAAKAGSEEGPGVF
ncbi:MAG: amino acid racemase [Alphaproteobacteria bacterium]|nr:amino acid racemase [Alphaproteobacteria bacterium]